jgi:hypothetical protein
MLLHVWIGSVAGLIVSSWQSFKDPPWEGFSAVKFVRSIGVGMLMAFILSMMSARGLLSIDNLGAFAFSVLTLERMAGEGVKGFFRRREHAEFHKLLHRIHIPAHIYPVKIAVGVGYVAGSVWLLRWLSRRLEWMMAGSDNPLIPGAVFGMIGGLLVATGGALKDSQFEGFLPLKFARSPIVGTLTGMLMIHYSSTPLLVLLSAIGSERVLVECYKTFLLRRTRGIFDGKPILHPQWLRRRPAFALTYAAAVGVCVFLLGRSA